MTPDKPSTDTETLAPGRDDQASPHRKRLGARATLFAGVAGACVLGAGLGLWARPAANERGVAIAPPPQDAPAPAPGGRTLQIVVNDGPAAPVGAPIAVLPTAPQPLFSTLRPARASGELAPTPALTRLEPKPWPKLAPPHFALPDITPLATAALAAPEHWLQRIKTEAAAREVAEATAKRAMAERTAALRAQAEAQAEAQARTEAGAKLAAEHAAQRAALAKQRLLARQAAEAHAAAHKVELAKAEKAKAVARAAAAKAEQVRLAQAKAARIQQARLEADHLAQAKARQVRLQQAKLAEARTAHAEKLRAAKAEKAEAIKLAQAEARGRAEARAEARALVLAEAREEAKKRERLEALVHAVQKVLPRAQPQSAQVAKLDHRRAAGRKHDPQVERASLKTRRAAAHATEPPAARRHPAPAIPANPSGLMRVSAPRCASHDPGAALVCADPELTAADRQMARAYQGARAAGVPDGQLQAQQQHWLAARSAAAREAPWAVRDVYLARIAELNSQAREAHDEN